ncbi:MAG: alpha-ketoglutarate-dependent dioxygenase AlkB [Brumimicrobium sp.]|nr:alpha-ketoglutarate-dependent dioxygenase AlkB [Brumimicrobium sp.]
MIRQTVQNGWYIYCPDFFSQSEGESFLRYFLRELDWQQEDIRLFGKQVKIPRKEVMFGEEGVSYGYSGKRLATYSFDPKVAQIKSLISQRFGFSFNACLANLYRDGQDSNGWHSDDEKELGKNPVIASVSFGATRKFQLKHKETNERIDLLLSSGSVLIMGGEMQHFWKHQVPKTLKPVEARVNLTFRRVEGGNGKLES